MHKVKKSVVLGLCLQNTQASTNLSVHSPDGEASQNFNILERRSQRRFLELFVLTGSVIFFVLIGVPKFLLTPVGVLVPPKLIGAQRCLVVLLIIVIFVLLVVGLVERVLAAFAFVKRIIMASEDIPRE